ncbi:TonB-dependent receptor [Acidithiobacillus thiooxidans]|uniref:Vitamin B12 transporter BtuB n=3 Tax=Acidithiobacillaceae TaxID=225058 RepID=A0A543PYJ2_ACITH|nr:TonB-dependent receptor plug domain-containing protein [Acidithiobacillus thiooxidans]TQN49158.1 Vitamin B12 transporter BtuB [Acidithiobacillus thiooxidans ATCC 19377]TQN49163.1 Vitamin B12 transporter BtuB [Acidithiobacillus thiooxidans ATCC 19377]TQN49498.1 Vitamin B12 transporter BtuB [Acidithiobacillus thiooxidans ATCC 19377]
MIQRRKFKNSTFILLALSSTVAFSDNAYAHELTHEKTKSSKQSVHIREVIKEAQAAKVDGVPMNSTYASSYIGKRAIKLASPVTSPQELLNRRPGIVATAGGPLGVRQHIRFRGFSDGAFTEEFDGIPLNNAFTGYSVSRANRIPITINNISGVKIYDGVNNPSVSGPQSLAGTINYLPKKPTKHFYASGGIGYGSFDTFLWNATVNTGSFYGLQSYLSYNRQTSDGWVANSQTQNSNYYYAGLIPYDHGKGKISLYAIVNRNIANKPRSIAAPLITKYGYDYSYPSSLRSDLYKDTKLTAILDDKNIVNRFLTTNFKFYVKNNIESELEYHNPNFYQSAQYPYIYKSLYFSDYDLYQKGAPSYDPEKAFGSVAKGTDFRYAPTVTTTVGFVPQFILTLPDNLVTIGAQTYFAKQHDGEFWYGDANVPQIPGYNDTYDEHDTRIFASPYIQDDIRLFDGLIHVTPGIKYIFSHISTSEDVGYEYPLGANLTASSNTSFVAPSVGINLHPWRPLSFYFAWGKNVEVPYASETDGAIQKNKAGNYVIAPIHLQPEYVNDYEFGTRLHYAHAQLSVKLYRENLTNIFNSVMNPITGLTVEINNGNELAQGIELGARYTFGHILLGSWQGYANYSLNTRKYEYTTSYDVPGESVDGSNYSSINVGLNWNWGSLQANLNGRYVSARRLHNYITGRIGKLTIPAYFLLDLGMNDRIKLHNTFAKSVDLSLTLDNLLNRQYFAYGYADTDYYNQYYLNGEVGMPRAVFGTVTVRF